VNSRSFKVIAADTNKMLVTITCYDKQHVSAYLKPFSRCTQEISGKITTFEGKGGSRLWNPPAPTSLNLMGIRTWTAKIYVWCWKLHMQVILVYLQPFRRNLLHGARNFVTEN